MALSLIAALSCNGIIGRDGALPWHLPADLAHFKAKTLGRTVVMGRKTYDSIGHPLPRRRNVVLSRTAPRPIAGALPGAGVEYFGSFDAALAQLGDEDVVLIGGASIYELALDRVTQMYLTVVHQEVRGDVGFPAFDESAWGVRAKTLRPADQRNPVDMTFLELVRRSEHPEVTPLTRPFPQGYCS